MNGNLPEPPSPARSSQAAPGWLPALHAASLQLAEAFSPSAYTPPHRRAAARAICRLTAEAAPRFLLLAGLLSLVVVHIVVVTAQSYGLSQFALSTVIRVLVVELLPLAAALFIALRGDPAQVGAAARLPAVVSRFFAVVMLVAISGSLALAFAYLGVFGFTPWGMAAFTRTVGQVFDPAVLMALALKTLLFAAIIATLSGTVRLFAALLAIEALVLAVEFF